MLVFLEEIITVFKTNPIKKKQTNNKVMESSKIDKSVKENLRLEKKHIEKNKGTIKNKLITNIIDKLIDKIKLALFKCENYYYKYKEKNNKIVFNSNIKESIKSLDVVFMIIYSTIFVIFILFQIFN
ncbi:MAG: hypothetical protein ACOCUI_01420 [bacterium]